MFLTCFNLLRVENLVRVQYMCHIYYHSVNLKKIPEHRKTVKVEFVLAQSSYHFLFLCVCFFLVNSTKSLILCITECISKSSYALWDNIQGGFSPQLH